MSAFPIAYRLGAALVLCPAVSFAQSPLDECAERFIGGDIANAPVVGDAAPGQPFGANVRATFTRDKANCYVREEAWEDFLDCEDGDDPKRLKPRFRQSLIATRQGEQFTGDGFGSIFRRAVDRAITAKTLNESFAFNDIRSKSARDTVDVGEASERLGHTSTAVTLKHYIRKPRSVKPLR